MKYRIWDKEGEGYLFAKQYFVNQDEKVCFERYDNILSNQAKYIIEQSTGITDINGVELYEGDECHAMWNKDYILEVWKDRNGQLWLGNNTLHYVANEFIKIGTIHDKEN